MWHHCLPLSVVVSPPTQAPLQQPPSKVTIHPNTCKVCWQDGAAICFMHLALTMTSNCVAEQRQHLTCPCTHRECRSRSFRRCYDAALLRNHRGWGRFPDSPAQHRLVDSLHCHSAGSAHGHHHLWWLCTCWSAHAGQFHANIIFNFCQSHYFNLFACFVAGNYCCWL